MGPYRQGLYRYCTIPADKGPIHTMSPYRKGYHTDQRPYRQGTPADAVQFLQTKNPYMIYRQCHKGLL